LKLLPEHIRFAELKRQILLMLTFVEVQKFTTSDELSDIVERGSQYNSMIFVVPLLHNPFPDIIIHDRTDGNSSIPAKTGSGLTEESLNASLSEPKPNLYGNRAVRLNC